MANDRRKFLQAVGAGATAATFMSSIRRALALPAHHRTGSIADVEHIVILMQENRSFDHYFGTMRGVRGFSDPRAVSLPSGDPVWAQRGTAGPVWPFRPTAPNLGLQFLEDLPHGWSDTHQAWNGGRYDQWVPAKGTTTMSYLTRKDIPFHFALADAFTVCDAYYCSFLGATDPNRYHMWTGWTGNDGRGGGPVLDNSETGYGWTTFPERLQSAGISWKIYQDAGAGLDAAHYWGWGSDAYVGNYGDNSLLYFGQYQDALPGTPLFQGARNATDIAQKGTLFDQFRADVQGNRLPQVSWLVAPEAYTEHPNWPANYGAWYISQMLDALTANPAVWSKTVFFLMYDENDGFFDHMVPPTPPETPAQGLSTVVTTNELFPGNAKYASGPYGLGVRVPMIVISPWSKGGWVNSQVFDHTSLIRFIEQRFSEQCGGGLREANITDWRRAVCGDLTSAFNFRSPDAALVALPSTSGYEPPDHAVHADYVPAPPVDQHMPSQEPGTRRARALPYELRVHADVDTAHGSVRLHFVNAGRVAAVFQVRGAPAQAGYGPWTYTVGAQDHLSDNLPVASGGAGAYDLSVYGPNGFFRRFTGTLPEAEVTDLDIRASASGDGDCGLTLQVRNRGRANVSLVIRDGYGKREPTTHRLQPADELSHHLSLISTFGWYDLTIAIEGAATFTRQLAGHVETGDDSMSDPALGAR